MQKAKLSTVKILLIGNGRFDDEQNISNLPNVSVNITLLENFFSSNPFYKSFESVSIETLLDRNHYEIHRIVEKLTQSLPLQSRILVYYCGHGLYSSSTGKYFLASKDSDVSIIDSTSIDVDKLLVPLKKCKAREKILIVDACYSGKIHENLSDHKTTIYAQMVESAQGIYVATSTNAASTARFDPDAPQSPTYFTKSLIETIDRWPDGSEEFLTMNEIFEEVTFELLSQGLSKPVKTIKGDAEKFIFCANYKFYEQINKEQERISLEQEEIALTLKLEEERIIKEREEREAKEKENAEREQQAQLQLKKEVEEKEWEKTNKERNNNTTKDRQSLQKSTVTEQDHLVAPSRTNKIFLNKSFLLILGSTIVAMFGFIVVIYLLANKKDSTLSNDFVIPIQDSLKKYDSSAFKVSDTGNSATSTFNPKSLEAIQYVDSLNKVVALKYKRGYDDKVAEMTQVRYIKALMALGDFYYANNDFDKAFYYYKKIADLSIGTDSDLGDNGKSLDERAKSVRKLIAMYKADQMPVNQRAHFIQFVIDEYSVSENEREYFSQKFFGTTGSILFVSQLTNVSNRKFFSIYLNPFKQKLIKTNTELKSRLYEYADYLRNNPEKTVEIITHSLPNNAIRKQYNWDNSSYIERYLVEIEGISEDRVKLITKSDQKNYKGILIQYIEIISS